MQRFSSNILQFSHNQDPLQQFSSSQLYQNEISPVRSYHSPSKISSDKSRFRIPAVHDSLDLMLNSNPERFNRLISQDNEQLMKNWNVVDDRKNQFYQNHDYKYQPQQHKLFQDTPSITINEPRKPLKLMPYQIENNYYGIDFKSYIDNKKQNYSKDHVQSFLPEPSIISKSTFETQSKNFSHSEQKPTVNRYHKASTEHLDKVQISRTRNILKKTIIQLNTHCEIEDFFKIDDNFQANQQRKKNKTLKNQYRLTGFTQWVEEIYGANWFRVNLEQQVVSPSRTRFMQKVEEDEFMRGLNFDK